MRYLESQPPFDYIVRAERQRESTPQRSALALPPAYDGYDPLQGP